MLKVTRVGSLGITAVAALALAACSNLSPATVNNPYPPSDGVLATLTLPNSRAEVKLRNFLIVGSTIGGPGEVVGSVINGSDSAVSVTFTADQGTDGPTTQFRVTVPGGGVTRVGPDQDSQIALQVVPGGPGALVAMTAATAGSGSVPLSVPVVEPAGEYATLAPRPTPTATETSTSEPTATSTKTSKSSSSSESTSTTEPTATAS